MASKNTLNKVRQNMERIRKESLDTAANANKIVYDGVQRLIDAELKSLDQSYREAIKSLKTARTAGSPAKAVGQQIDMLQDTANRVIASTREAVKIVSETRDELTKLMRKNAAGTKVTKAQIEKTATRARKAVKKARSTAKKAASKSAKRVGGASKATSKKTTRKSSRKSTAKKTARKSTTKSARKKAASKKRSRPSPSSRAGAATSQAKKAARKAGSTPSSSSNNN